MFSHNLSLYYQFFTQKYISITLIRNCTCTPSFNFGHIVVSEQSYRETSTSAMAERPHELDQRFQVGVNLRPNYRLKGYFSHHCDMTQFTLTHH